MTYDRGQFINPTTRAAIEAEADELGVDRQQYVNAIVAANCRRVIEAEMFKVGEYFTLENNVEYRITHVDTDFQLHAFSLAEGHKSLDVSGLITIVNESGSRLQICIKVMDSDVDWIYHAVDTGKSNPFDLPMPVILIAYEGQFPAEQDVIGDAIRRAPFHNIDSVFEKIWLCKNQDVEDFVREDIYNEL